MRPTTRLSTNNQANNLSKITTTNNQKGKTPLLTTRRPSRNPPTLKQIPKANSQRPSPHTQSKGTRTTPRQSLYPSRQPRPVQNQKNTKTQPLRITKQNTQLKTSQPSPHTTKRNHTQGLAYPQTLCPKRPNRVSSYSPQPPPLQ